MGWKYGDPIFIGDRELEVGSDEYDVWAGLAGIVGGDDDETEDE